MDSLNLKDWQKQGTLRLPVMTAPTKTTGGSTSAIPRLPENASPDDTIVAQIPVLAGTELKTKTQPLQLLTSKFIKPVPTPKTISQPSITSAAPRLDPNGATTVMPVIQEPVRKRSLVDVFSGELPLILALMLIGLVTVGLNIFNYPAHNRFDDEGIYLSQAWSVLREGRLSPYSYFYDHAPGGWLMLAGWMGLTGGPLTFGSSYNSGRLFILLLHVAMIPLLYKVARKLGCNISIAALASLLFSISPLAIYYERLILLDNIMLFWVLLSLNLLLDEKGRLSRLAISGICFGIAVLTKETAAFLIPAMLFIAWQQRYKHQGRFALLGWVIPTLLMLSLYPLYALIKGELLPAGYSLGFFIFNIATPSDKISLLDVLRWQAGRGSNGQFWQLLKDDWLLRDPILFGGGVIASVINLFWVFRKDRRPFAASLLALLPLLYLARGGLVFDFYVIFIIPFLCLNLAILLNNLSKRLPELATAGLVVLVTGVLVIGYWRAGTLQPLYKADPAQADRAAVTWIKTNIPAQSTIVARSNMWTDLHEPGLGGPAFPNVQSHWKVALDPAIREGVFHNDWHNVDYVVVDTQMKSDLTDLKATLVLDALNHASLVKQWQADGNLVQLWKVNNGKHG